MNRLSILHGIWRVLTIVVVLVLALLTSFVLIPFLDRRLPIFPVILISYALVAYVLLPMVGRFWQLVIKPNHIPRYVVTPDGWPADPINIAIVAKSRRHFIRSMKKAGWYTADPSTLRNRIREGYAILLDKPYPNAPFSAMYLFGRKFDIGFQIAYGKNKSPRHRHHVRFWQLIDLPDVPHDDIHFAYWFERIKHLFLRRRKVWIGAAIDDVQPIGVRWRNLQLTHANSGEHTEERDFIIESLSRQHLISSITDIKDGEPFKMQSQNIGTRFVVDGYIKVIELKNPLLKKLKKH